MSNMKKSLLEILEEEKQAVADERFYADSLKDFADYAEKEDGNAKTFYTICTDYAKRRAEAERRIFAARMELKVYLSELEKLA